jgi:amino-acid N-acetyltransferase
MPISLLNESVRGKTSQIRLLSEWRVVPASRERNAEPDSSLPLTMIRDLRIRMAAPEEWPEVVQVLRRCGLPVTEQEPRADAYHVALLERRIVGCAGGETYGGSFVVRSVAVLPEYRDGGIASHLVSTLLMRARANGCRHAVLLSAVCPAYFARYGFALKPAEQLPADVQASPDFTGRGTPPSMCMHCELR